MFFVVIIRQIHHWFFEIRFTWTCWDFRLVPKTDLLWCFWTMQIFVWIIVILSYNRCVRHHMESDSSVSVCLCFDFHWSLQASSERESWGRRIFRHECNPLTCYFLLLDQLLHAVVTCTAQSHLYRGTSTPPLMTGSVGVDIASSVDINEHEDSFLLLFFGLFQLLEFSGWCGGVDIQCQWSCIFFLLLYAIGEWKVRYKNVFLKNDTKTSREKGSR